MFQFFLVLLLLLLFLLLTSQESLTSSSAVARLSFFVGVPAVDGSPTFVNIPFVIRVYTNSGVPDVPFVSFAARGPPVAVILSAVNVPG